jgi:acetyl esterase/lipase
MFLHSALRPPSLRSRLLELWLRATGRKARDHELRRRIARGWQPSHAPPPLHLRLRHRITRREVLGSTVWTIAPAGTPGPLHILFLHGGAYVNGLIRPYWRFLAGLVDATGAQMVVPEYPLAPAHHANDVHHLVLTLYRELGAATGGRALVVMGASSGGGIAVALAQRLRDLGIPEPARLVLVSPWLDVTMRNPALVDADARDPMLDLKGLRDAGRLYAGSQPPEDPLVSPLYGPLERLPPVTVLVGTHDVLLPDVRRFRDLARAAGVRVDYHEFREMVHEWTLRRLPEARAARQLLVQVLRRVAGRAGLQALATGGPGVPPGP